MTPEQAQANIAAVIRNARQDGIADGTAAENERCAKIADGEKVEINSTSDEGDYSHNNTCDDIAKKIRSGQ